MREGHVLQFCHGYEGPFADVARQYAALFNNTSYQVTTVFLTGEPNPGVKELLSPGEVIFLGYQSQQVRGLKLGAIKAIKNLVSQRKFSLCIAHRFKPIYIACLATSLPVIGVHHAFGDYTRPLRRFFVNLFHRRLALLGVSNAVRDDIRRCLPGWPPERIETLHNRIDVESVRAELLPKEKARKELNLPEDAFIVANVGRLHPDKDQATLLRGFAEALSNLPGPSLLVILGRGRLEADLRRLASELGISRKVLFLGQVPQARRFFKAFDIFVLSSDHEPFGMVLLEAMAAEVPIIATDCGGAPEVISGVGELFSFGSNSELAEHLVKISTNYASFVNKQGLIRLRERFSDQAGKDSFMSLTGVKELRAG